MKIQNENSVINYSPSCRSKPVRPTFIFRTHIKIFLMKSESSLTLHRQQRNCNVPRPRNVARTSIYCPCDISGSTSILRNYENTLCAKKTKITIYSTILLPEFPSSTILESTTTHACVINIIRVTLTTLITLITHACVVVLSKMAEDSKWNNNDALLLHFIIILFGYYMDSLDI